MGGGSEVAEQYIVGVPQLASENVSCSRTSASSWIWSDETGRRFPAWKPRASPPLRCMGLEVSTLGTPYRRTSCENRRTPPPRAESPCFCARRRRGCRAAPVPPDRTGPCPSGNPRPHFQERSTAGPPLLAPVFQVCKRRLLHLPLLPKRAAEWEKPETDSRHVPFYSRYNGDVLEKPNTAGRAEGG